MSSPYAYMEATDKQVGGNHYSQWKIQPITFITENNLDFCTGNVIKYTLRHREKNKAQDIRKAIHYLEFILENEYGERND